MYRLTPLVLLPLLTVGCVTFGGGERRAESMPDVIELEEGNFRIVKQGVRGEATCPTILYINLDFGQLFGADWGLGAFGIGLADPALRRRAMEDLHSKFEMQGPQVLVNVVEEYSTSGFLFFYRNVKLTITADVLQFIEDA